MNFGMLKNMVENLVSAYKCPYCASQNITEQHIDIVGAAGNTVNIDMHCPSCNRHFMAKTEMVQMDLGAISPEKLAQIQKTLLALKWKLWGNLEIDVQKIESKVNQNLEIDTQIRDLQKTLQAQDFSVEDLFSSEEKND